MIQPASHSDILSVSQPVNRSASKSGRQSVIQSINQSVSQSVSRSAGQSFRQPACQSVSGAVNFCSGGSSSAVPPFLAGPTPPGLDPVHGSVTPGACFYHKNQGESNTLVPAPPPKLMFLGVLGGLVLLYNTGGSNIIVATRPGQNYYFACPRQLALIENLQPFTQSVSQSDT